VTGRCETPSERSPQDESQDARRRLRHAGFTCTARYLRRLAGRSTNSAARSLTMGKPHARPSVAHGLDSSRLPEGWRLHRIWLAPAALAPCAGKPALIPALLSIDRRLAVPLFGQRARQHPPEKDALESDSSASSVVAAHLTLRSGLRRPPGCNRTHRQGLHARPDSQVRYRLL